MIGFTRVILFWAVAGTIAYFVLRIYGRSLRREALEKSWDANPPPGADAVTRAAFIEKGMADYEGSLRNRLLVIVVVLPFIVIAVLLYLMNYA
ncbi:MAG: hypothetical protein B7Z10_07050 [Rhodobacterales bacterium 32-66-7]|nr:MAG: hypothetical protein B7Z31_00790 [Rhodobacterales bacterium 12-65-15]OYX25215.1 MAG: hypothetical protein B7Z10_07050 [Rhodobacterales bacterium 32-66-7]